MSGPSKPSSDKSKNTSTSADSLTKSASVELSEKALGEASGGAVFPSGPTTSLKLDTALKLDPAALLPAVDKI